MAMEYTSQLSPARTVTLDIDESKKYGILLSGGIDSAILLYLLLKTSPSINLRTYTVAKTDGALEHSNRIVEHFNKKFTANIPAPGVVGDPTLHHSMQVVSAVHAAYKKGVTHRLFIGTNQNPPELAGLVGAPNRPIGSPSKYVLLPFIDLYKSHILDFMYQFNQEDLVNITHSCTEQPVGRCNSCWHCSERTWAFRQLNKIDTGKL